MQYSTSVLTPFNLKNRTMW